MLLGFFNCQETLARLGNYIDRELSPAETQRVEQHLKICRDCAHRFAFEEHFAASLRDKVDHLQMPPELLDRIRTDLYSSESSALPPPGNPSLEPTTENFPSSGTDFN